MMRFFFTYFSSYILFYWGQEVAWADTKGQKMNGIEIHDVKDTKNKNLKKNCKFIIVRNYTVKKPDETIIVSNKAHSKQWG